MEKKEIKEVVEKVIKMSKDEKISLQETEKIIINILKKRNQGELSKEHIKYIKKLVDEKYQGDKKNRIEISDDLKNLSFFKPIAPTTDITPMDITNAVFDIANDGLGTFIEKKTNPNIKNNSVSPDAKTLNEISNPFFKILKDSFNTERKNNKEVSKTLDKDAVNTLTKEIVEANSENMKKNGKLKSNEEEFIKNISKLFK